jgi:metal-responsive CopG/Arc/MetJ family transcriptional regulator
MRKVKYVEQVATNVPPELLRQIDECAEAAGMSRSAWLRRAISLAVADAMTLEWMKRS